jgi:uncharacterized protein YciI
MVPGECGCRTGCQAYEIGRPVSTAPEIQPCSLSLNDKGLRKEIAMPLYTKVFKSEASPDAFDKVMPAMMAYLGQLKASGKLKHSGPFADYSGGLDIFEAADQEEATKIAEEDPLIVNKLGTYELKEWTDMMNEI